MNQKVYFISAPTNEKRKSYPYSLMFLHGYLAKKGFESEVLDCNALKWNLDDLLRHLVEEKADIIGLTGYTFNRFYAYKTIREIKSRLPGSRIIVGGRHFSSLAHETIERMKEVDYVVRGEGELTLKELCESIYSGKEPRGVAGITYRGDGGIISNPDRPPVLDLEELHYNLNDFSKVKGDYSFISTMRRFPASKSFSIMTGRGCFGSCVFCSLSSKRIRFRNTESILDEVEHLMRMTGLSNVTFDDPSLTASKRHLVALCEGILKRGLNIKWRCYSRADVPSEIFELMKRSGCVGVDIALESASPRVLKAIKKHIDVEDVRRCVKKLNELDIKSFVYTMISLPDEREEDAEMTVRFLEETADVVDGSTLAITQIFPDAELYAMAKEKNLMPRGFNWFDDYHNGYYDRNNVKSTAPFYIENLTFDYIERMYRRFRKIYMRKYYDRYTFRDEVRKSLRPFLLDWKNETLPIKIRKIKNGLARLPYAFRSRPRSSA